MEVLNSNFESGLDQVSDEMLKYIGITNLDFRTSLSKDDLEEVQRMLFSINTLMHVTFRDGVNVNDIENIKHVLELSPMCDDKKIEKMILRENTPMEIKELLAMPYMNPETWNISYEVKDGTYMITTLPNYRVMEEYINIVLSCVKEGMTPLEKIKEVYDFVKLLNYDENGSNRIPDIIITRKTGSLGYNLLFSEILKRVGINSYIGEISRGSKIENVTIIDVCDQKYNADGIYVFDPASDSIPKELYKSDAIRKVNYNFFCLSLSEVVNTKDNDRLLGILALLNSDSLEFSSRKILDKDKKKLEKLFNYSYEEIFERVKKTKIIDSNILIDFFVSHVHEDDFLGLNRNIKELLSNNYYLRKSEIFNDDNDKGISKVNVHDV